MLELVEIQRVVNQGMTKPLLCKGSDGKSYYAKGKRATASGLIKEWMIAHLAKAFSLPIPNFHIAYIDSRLIDCFGEETSQSFGFGQVFVSEQVKSAKDFDYSLIDKISPELKKDILIFDLWIENSDRTLTTIAGNPNLLWSELTNKLYIIDHNLAFDDDFKLEDSWDLHPFARNFQLDIHEREALEERLTTSLQNWWQWWGEIPEKWIEQHEESGLFNVNQILERLTAEAQGDIWGKL